MVGVRSVRLASQVLNWLKSSPSVSEYLNVTPVEQCQCGDLFILTWFLDFTWEDRLFNCRITEEGCAALASALKLNPSHLRELNLNFNNPGESGVKLLSDLLEDPHCKLEKL
ncbi:hypothetical protein NFI96_034272 [Prochilodus magdalenae]|nr:hypothetical protein NFI96_034272 [Prochilodus magdalenae]